MNPFIKAAANIAKEVDNIWTNAAQRSETILRTAAVAVTGSQHAFSEKEIINLIEEHAKQNGLWSLLYPRIYENAPATHCSPKLVAAMFYEGLTGPIAEQPFTKPIVAKLVRYSMPTLWLSQSLTQAMQHTVPAACDLLDIHLPMPAMAIMLPKGTIPTKNNDEVRFIAYARYEAEELVKLGSDPTVDPHLFFCSVTSKGVIQALSMSHKTSKVDLSDLDAFVHNLNTKGSTKDSTGEGTDENQNKQAIFYFLNTMLIMTARHDLVTEPKLLSRVQHKHKETREFWSPHILGANYVVKRNAPTEGTHQSPRLHWVRGFTRNQPYGPRTKPEYRAKWIEPFLRGN